MKTIKYAIYDKDYKKYALIKENELLGYVDIDKATLYNTEKEALNMINESTEEVIAVKVSSY